MSAAVEKWEYLTGFYYAELRDSSLRKQGYGQFHPIAMQSDFDRLGEAGWELVHIEPVSKGGNDDIQVFSAQSGNTNVWTHTYFVVFKRRKA